MLRRNKNTVPSVTIQMCLRAGCHMSGTLLCRCVLDVRKAQVTMTNGMSLGNIPSIWSVEKSHPLNIYLFAFHRIVMHQIAHTNQSRSKKTDT